MNEVTRLLKTHRSIRKFTEQPVSDEMIHEIITCGQAAATSSNIQAVSVIRIRNPATRKQLAALSGDQGYVTRAGAFLVFCADLARPRFACEMQGGDFAQGMTEQFLIATVDVALAAQNCVVAAESLGLGICYIGGIRNHPQAVADLLRLPEDVYPVFGLCLGFPAQNPQTKPRLPLSVVFQEEYYPAHQDQQAIEAYDQQMRNYYQTRTGGNKNSSWSQEICSLIGKESRPHMRGFLARRGFSMR
ncbi:MAG TPA: oxygen-insensitive NADPH nitroreductase [Gammaproteobacteria bacterium]|nr:oxygen-insensitive NADPH nitroreductase [Gammaproteobacteria bacterium]